MEELAKSKRCKHVNKRTNNQQWQSLQQNMKLSQKVFFQIIVLQKTFDSPFSLYPLMLFYSEFFFFYLDSHIQMPNNSRKIHLQWRICLSKQKVHEDIKYDIYLDYSRLYCSLSSWMQNRAHKDSRRKLFNWKRRYSPLQKCL